MTTTHVPPCRVMDEPCGSETCLLLCVPHLICKGCGTTANGPHGSPTDVAPSSHCGNCPPWDCEWCGQLNDMLNPCSCWISLEGMALADIKALFASDESDGPSLSIGGMA